MTETRLEPLIDAADDWRVLAAADGMRPAFDDAAPIGSDRVRFAPSAASYRASAYGHGTEVLLFGNAPSGASVAAVVSGFYPYMFVRVEAGDDVRALVAELDASLAALVALDTSRTWSPEYKALREAIAGSIRPRRDKSRWLLFAPDAERVRRQSPIVGYETVDATMLCGTGEERGYRGIEARRFLKLYFYSPSYVSKCRSLLHGRFAERGWLEQLRALGVPGRRDGGETTAVDSSTAVARGQKTMDQMWLPHNDIDGDAADDNDDDDDDDDDGVSTTMLGALDAAEEALVFDDEPDELVDALANLALGDDERAPAPNVLADAPYGADGARRSRSAPTS